MPDDPIETSVVECQSDRGAGRRIFAPTTGRSSWTSDLRKWLAGTGAKKAYIEPGSPWENGYCETFNSKLRDEFLNGEIFYAMKEIRGWRNGGGCTTTPAAGAGGPGGKEFGAWRSGNRYALPILPHPDGDDLNTKIAALH